MDYRNKLEELITTAVRQGASDIHLTNSYRPTLRIAAALVPLVKEKPLTSEDTRGFMEVLLPPASREVFLREQEMDFSWSLGDEVRFRGNCYFSAKAIGISLRIIPKRIQSLEELNLPESLKQFTQIRQGFFLVVGPAGQGKSTTIASMLEIINMERAEHIITIEDPIEFVFEPKKSVIEQREVRIDTKTFDSALKHTFRQDVDVIMIGEMRSLETISAAVTAGETGHLVFSTLHTNDAAQTVDRIIDSFPPRQQDQVRLQLAGSLAGVFSQRLIPRVSGGLIPSYELLINNNAVANLIRESRAHEINTVIETGLESGMVDMNRSLAALVQSGEVTPEEARKYSLNPKVLDKML